MDCKTLEFLSLQQVTYDKVVDLKASPDLMDTLWLRFPHIFGTVLEFLDNQSISNCRHVNKSWKNSIDSNKTIWHRIIAKKLIHMNNSKSWKYILDKVPFEILKEIGEGVMKFLSDIEKDMPSYYGLLYSPMHTTAGLGLLKASKYIVTKTNDCNPANSWGHTPLHLAAERDHTDICRLIIDNVSDKNPCDYHERWTPLHYAARNGNVEICQLILANVSSKNPASDNGLTPLHRAALFGNIEICQVIMENVSDINPADNDGWTPLHDAAGEGHVEICKYIIDNVSVKNPAKNDGSTPLHLAAEKGHVEVCRLIMDNVSDKNPADDEGETPLHWAARYGQLEICRLIMDNIYDKHPIDMYGCTPLHLAIKNGHYEMDQFTFI